VAARAHALVFHGDELSRLRHALLTDAPWETAAFLLARPVATPGGTWRLLVYDTMTVAPEEYAARSESTIQLPPAVVARVMQRARRERASVVLVHTHPADGPARPSPLDRVGERMLVPAFARRVPGLPHARLILGPTLTHAALFVPRGLNHGADLATVAEAHAEASLTVIEVGRDVHILPNVDAAEEDNGMSSSDTSAASTADAFDRQVRAFGAAGQAQLCRLRVAVIGVGGTGSVVVEQLAHLGVEDLLLVDPDVIERSNLNRVVGSVSGDVGRHKVDVAAALVERIRPGARIERLRADVRDQAVARRLLDVDFFFGCTDSQGSRAVLSQFAHQYLIPGIDMGVAIHARDGEVSHISGRVQMLAPGLACLLCSHVLDPEAVRRDLLTDEARAADSYIIGAAVPQPAVISINSAATSLAVTMFLSAAVGIPVAARHQRLRFETGIVSSIATEPMSGCPWCSPGGALARGDTWPMPGRGASPVTLAAPSEAATASSEIRG
jgi:molybdopterin/thiamine biosynthesis adenylyltransferase